MKNAILVITSCLGLVTGCVTPMHTASGKPEVTVAASNAQVRSAVANAFVNSGFHVYSSDPMALVFEKNAGFAASMFFGTVFNPTAQHRVRVSLIDQGTNSVRVMMMPLIVSNPHSGWEREHEHSGAFAESDYLLQCIKADAEGTPRPQPPPEPPAPKAVAGGRAMQ